MGTCNYLVFWLNNVYSNDITSIVSLAHDNDRYAKVIIEEYGEGQPLKLAKMDEYRFWKMYQVLLANLEVTLKVSTNC